MTRSETNNIIDDVFSPLITRLDIIDAIAIKASEDHNQFINSYQDDKINELAKTISSPEPKSATIDQEKLIIAFVDLAFLLFPEFTAPAKVAWGATKIVNPYFKIIVELIEISTEGSIASSDVKGDKQHDFKTKIDINQIKVQLNKYNNISINEIEFDYEVFFIRLKDDWSDQNFKLWATIGDCTYNTPPVVLNSAVFSSITSNTQVWSSQMRCKLNKIRDRFKNYINDVEFTSQEDVIAAAKWF